jgi:two-component system sensor histidine kinase YesM
MSNNTNRAKKRLLYRHFGNIFFKNLKLTSLIIILPVALMVAICYIAFQNYLKSEIIIYSGKSIRAIQSETDRIFNECASQMNFLLADLDVSVFLQTDRGDPMLYDYRYLNKMIQLQRYTQDYMYGTYIYSERNGYVVSNMGVVEPENLYDSSWLDSYEKNKDQRFRIEFRETNSSSRIVPRRLISIYETVAYGYGSDGVVICNIDYDLFIKHISTLRGEYDAALSIVDENDAMVANLWGDPADYLTSANLGAFRNDKDYVQADRLILYRAPIAGSRWQYIFAVPIAMYDANLASLRGMLLGITIGGTAATILIAVLISLRIYRPFRNIAGVLGNPLDFPETVAFNDDEEGHIISAIKKTIHENAAISKELEERIVLLKQAQNLALQTQINPHFLYNTLDAINWTAMRLTGGKNDVSIMLGKLASMLRYCLENAETLVPLQHELDNARTYLDLQMIRYKGKFTVEWNIADETRNVPVMKLLLQPLVENAIYHGVKPMPGQGVIGVSAVVTNHELVICVSDNGAGMPLRTLECLNNSMKSADVKEEQHIGIGNVNQRIRLFFGDKYGVFISAVEGKGAQVTVTIPVETERSFLSGMDA